MGEQRVYELDTDGNIIGQIIPMSQHPMYKLIRELKKKKIEEIKIIMDKYGIDIDDLKDDDDYD